MTSIGLRLENPYLYFPNVLLVKSHGAVVN